MTLLLKDRVCLVTGATRGIGRAIALAFAREGGIVYGTATSDAGADTIQAGFKEAGLTGFGRVLDVSVGEQVSGIVADITAASGAPLVLVNNAGITRDNLLLRMKDSEWDDIMATNLKSVFSVSKAVLRGMTKARFGRIISIASVVGVTGNAGQANYAAAKAGMIGFSKSLAQEVASRSITVNTIAPGFIETDMTGALSDDQRAAIMKKIPMSRLGSPDDIASAALFLASAMGNYVTGETIHVNGGMYMS
jgi:3-oxoacyl-[acyl-carrier protein] reductase